MIPMLHRFFVGSHLLTAKCWEDYLLHIGSADLFCKIFLILSLLILFIEKIHVLAALLTPWPWTEDVSYHQHNFVFLP